MTPISLNTELTIPFNKTLNASTRLLTTSQARACGSNNRHDSWRVRLVYLKTHMFACMVLLPAVLMVNVATMKKSLFVVMACLIPSLSVCTSPDSLIAESSNRKCSSLGSYPSRESQNARNSGADGDLGVLVEALDGHGH